MTIAARPLLVIAGPTASGKSALALEVARRLGGVVINADSMQVYCDLRILTARPSEADEAAVPHRLYGMIDGASLCSAAAWAALARDAIAASRGAGLVPILCGGTGLYIHTLLDGIAAVPPIPDDIREAARALHREIGGEAFRQKLALFDPEAASRLHANDSQRLTRAYEVVAATGVTLGDWQKRGGGAAPIDATIFAVLPPREDLYRAIDGRFATMIERGALDEVRRLVARGLSPALPVMKALGVPELAAYLAATLSLDQAIEQAQQSSRQYAKRQYTWFNHQLISPIVVNEQFMERNADLICQKVSFSA